MNVLYGMCSNFLSLLFSDTTDRKDTRHLFHTSVLKKSLRANCCAAIINSRFNCNPPVYPLVVENVFIVPGIQGLFPAFMVLLSCPRIFDCLQRLCQQTLGFECTTCIWSCCLNQSCAAKCRLNLWLTYCGCSNHCACLFASHGYLKLTRIGTMKQSEVTHIVMQWPGFSSFTFISLRLCYFLFLPFYFHYRFTPPPSPSLSAVGRRCMPVPRWRGGEINSEAVWSFLKDFPGKTLLSGW